MNDTLRFVRTWLAAGVVCVLGVTSCAAYSVHRESTFKTLALEKGLSATEINCAWDGSVRGDSGATKAECVLLASKESK